jgi:tape measure domain-containing protein
MAKGTGGGLNFTAKLSVEQAIKDAQRLKRELASIPGVTTAGGANLDTKPITGYQQAQLALKKTLIEAQAESQRLRNENIALSNSYRQGQISAQQLTAAERQSRIERRELAEASRAARQAQVSATGSYKEAQDRLKQLGRQIREVSGGFEAQGPIQKARIAEYNRLNESLKKFDAQMGNHQRNVGNYSSAIKGVVGDLKSMALGYLSVQGAIMAATAVFNEVVKNDATRTTLEFISKSSPLTEITLRNLGKTANRLGIDFDALSGAYAKFSGAANASHFPLEQTDRIFNAIAGSGARLHLSADQISGSLLAVQQMISKGTVQSEELRGQLGERLPGAFAIAARAMGVSEKELGKLLQTGQVLAADLLPKLAVELEKTFDLDATTSIDSLQAGMARLKNSFELAINDASGLNKYFFKPILDGFASIADMIAKTVTSTGWNEFFARLTSSKNGDVLRQLNTAYAGGRATLGTRDKTYSGANEMDTESLKVTLREIATQRAETAKAFNAYRSAVKSGSIKDGGENSLKNFKGQYDDLLAYENDIRSVLQGRVVTVKKVNKEIADAQLTSIADIRKRIAALSKLPDSATDGSAINKRIDALKARLTTNKTSIDTEVNSRNSLQARINELTKKGTDRQLSADAQEVESVKDKYAKMLKAANDFNNNPNNKKRGLRVDAGGLRSAESRELTALDDKQNVEKLKLSLDIQKGLYDDYEAYKTKVGAVEAGKRYANEIDTDKNYLESLRVKREALLGDDKAKGGADPVERAAVQQQLKVLDERIASEILANKKKDDEIYANAYQAAMTNSQALIAIDREYQQQVKALGAGATEEQINNLKRQRDARIRNENEANAYAKGGYDDLMINYDVMTRGAVIKRLQAIKAGYQEEYKAGKINAEQLANLTSSIDSQISKLNGNNSFKRISTAITNYTNKVKLLGKETEGAKDAQAEMFEAIADGATDASNVIGTLADSFQQLGIGGQGLQEDLKNIQGILTGAGDIAKGLATGNPVDVVTGSIKLLTSAISLFDKKDKNLQKKIDGYKRELDALGRSYADLDRAVKNAVGNDIYSDQAAQIENLRAQQLKLIQMRDAEEDKKKTDAEKVDELNNQIAEIPNQIEDIQQAISQNLIQGTFRELSNSLSDALAGAFQVGEDGILAMDKSFDQFIANAIKNSLKLSLLEPVVSAFTKELTDYAKGNGNSVIGFDFEAWKKKLEDAGKQFNAGLEESKEIFKPEDSSSGTALKKGIEGITSPQASALEGINRGQYDQQKQMVSQLTTNNFNWGKQLDIAMSGVRSLELIQVNTFNTVEELKKSNASLSAIVTNTKAKASGRDGGLI